MNRFLTIDWNEFIKEMYPEQPKPEEIKQAAKWKLSQITKSQGPVGGQSAGFGSMYGNQLPMHGWSVSIPAGKYPIFDGVFSVEPGPSSQPPTVDPSRFPHTCPACSKPAYIGFTTVECSNSLSVCRHGK